LSCSPQSVLLTQRFADAVKNLVAVIEDNAAFREVLNDIAMYENYFAALPVPTN
jgi:hypothetical protein